MASRSTSEAVKIFDSARADEPLAGLGAVSDPDINLIDGQWVMHFGAPYDNKINIFSARLPIGAKLTSDQWEIDRNPDSDLATSLVVQPEPGRWDEWLHTPCYVRTPEGEERIYYTGSVGGNGVETRRCSIGLMERLEGKWVRRPDPVSVGTHERMSMLEPVVRFHDGKWHMWCMNTAQEAGPGQKPFYWIVYSTSEDGVAWSPPVDIFTPEQNYFDASPIFVDEGAIFVTASAPNQFGEPEWQSQGLWLWFASFEQLAKKSTPSRPHRIFDVDTGPDWSHGGVYGPTIVRFEDMTGTTYQVYFTGLGTPQSQMRLSVGRIDIASDLIDDLARR